jgi:hypothetical protein
MRTFNINNIKDLKQILQDLVAIDGIVKRN